MTLSTFLPTRPLRDATEHVDKNDGRDIVSTHASLAGRDDEMAEIKKAESVSTHASLAGRDVNGMKNKIESIWFLPTRPLRDATANLTRKSSSDLRK